ncbi:hypothetical protein DNFV4_00088 [Nitrospira tepida]|uniref:Uncharacterized protein n=1 Tax=Nitrospira tepida TaxID=2973512 RepID=A0AA86MVB3_9BACT|nr:hypothetical protein [Nitrospira tepida]CAI4029670.1 hypothetical protein DNFV4_00088 [Nitrospira tepida]
MRRSRRQRFLGGPALAVLAGTVALVNVAWAVEIHFIAEERGEKRAAWVPQEVVVHRGTELQDGLVLVLKNPTYRTHAFAAYGLFEETMGANGNLMTRPLRVTVMPEDEVRVQISTAQFATGGTVSARVEEFPFFCPLHKGDAHAGGTIRVVP